MNLDTFSVIAKTQQLITNSKEKHQSRVINATGNSIGDNISYQIDYDVRSETAMGGKNTGTVYIRGVKSLDGGVDVFKFILEKSVDFSDLDADIIVQAFEEIFKPKPVQ